MIMWSRGWWICISVICECLPFRVGLRRSKLTVRIGVDMRRVICIMLWLSTIMLRILRCEMAEDI